MNPQKLKDVEDIKKQFEELYKNLNKLYHRFMAVAIDYKFYIDGTWNEHTIYGHRDNVFYRFKSAEFHVQLLINHHFVLEDKLQKIFQTTPEKISNSFWPSNPLYDQMEEEISSIFDSVVYHLSSVYDYIAGLINFICDNDKTKKIEWTQLSRTVRSDKSFYYNTPLAGTIDRIDREFVTKLYDHRSHLIHTKGEISKLLLTTLKNESEINFKVKFISTEKFVKSFRELKELKDEYFFTIQYTVFWVIEKTIKTVTDILFALKEHMEQNKKNTIPMMGYIENGQIKSGSFIYWEGTNPVEYEKQKKS